MEFHNPDGVEYGERCRVVWEGKCHINSDLQNEWATSRSWDSSLSQVLVSQTMTVSVENPDRVWIQSLHPDKIRARVMGEYPNPDAALLQAKLDQAEAQVTKLSAQIRNIRGGYEKSQALWKKKHRNKWWLADSIVEDLPAAIERGRPESDYNNDWD